MKSNQLQDWEIDVVMVMKTRQRQLKSELDSLTEQIAQSEQAILNRFLDEEFVRTETYSLQAHVAERRFPCWKELFISFLGKEKADEIVAKTEPKVYRTLRINKFVA